MSDRSLLTFFDYFKNLEWQMIDDMLEKNFRDILFKFICDIVLI